MKCKVLTYSEIDRDEWRRLVTESRMGTWFQSPEAYDFFASQPELFRPFAYGLDNDGKLRGICSGYVTKEKSALRQFFMRRAIIIGGPCLADDATDEEVTALMKAVVDSLRNPVTDNPSPLTAPIYIECRNLNDYSKWRLAFEAAGFSYQPHVNVQVDTSQPWEQIEANIGKHRKKYIRLSLRDGATIEEHPTIEQVRAYYDILLDLYKTKVRMPLYPWSFFERLCRTDACRFLLVMYNGQVVGGSTCMLLPGCGVYEWYACGKDGVYRNIHPSSLAKYAGIKYAVNNGYAVFDMMGAGEPGVPYGVRDFKSEFGGELVEHGRFLCVCKPWLYKIGEFAVKMLKRR